MVHVPTNGVNGSNGVMGERGREPQRNPYAPRYAEFLSNISNFSIIESTLRGKAFILFDLFYITRQALTISIYDSLW